MQGEPEYTVLEISKKVKENKRKFSNVKGIIFKKDKKIIVNPPRDRNKFR